MSKKKEVAESSASSGALFKEEIPRKIAVGDVWMNLHQEPPKRSRQLEGADQQDTLMGRLASRMTSRDMIDELNLGPKGRTSQAKKAVVADNDVPKAIRIEGPALKKGTKIEEEHSETVKKLKEDPSMSEKLVYKNIAKDHLNEHKDYYDDKKGLPAMEKKLTETASSALTGPGLHEQTADKKASNFANPILEGEKAPGRNMAEQAKNSGNVYDTMHKVETSQQKKLQNIRKK